MDPLSACLLLLTCLAGFSASETEEGGAVGESSYGPSSVQIVGVSIVTVGIPYGFQCTAVCYPDCKYTWTRGSVTSQGPELSLQLLHVVPTQTLSCTVFNSATGKSSTVQKTLQVTAGPSNIQISGPTYLTYGAESIFICSASCYPSCSYSWTVSWKGQTLSKANTGNISVTPYSSTVLEENLLCEAIDPISHLYITSSLLLPVASISDISIVGDSTVTMGKQYTFTCYAACYPSCNIVWKYMGKSYEGNQVQIPILHQGDKKKFACHLQITFNDYTKIEPLTCEAMNTVSHSISTSVMNLTVIDPISVHASSKGLPVGEKPFSLQCVGPQNPASITWLWNKLPMPASERVHFSSDNSTMTFNPLVHTDDGLYQCVVAEGGPPIQSVGYQMQVNYGPYGVGISGGDLLTVGMLYHFNCSVACYPTCLLTWTWGNVTSHGPEFSLQIEKLIPPQLLTCTAVNPVTGVELSGEKKMQVIAGPTNIHISGPGFLTAGIVSNFTCSADCYSSCSYSWTVTDDGLVLSNAQGNTISVTPSTSGIHFVENLTCTAQDTASHVYISKALLLAVASLSDISIVGNTTVTMGEQYMFTCSAACYPSCEIIWKYMGETFQGDHIEIPILKSAENKKFAKSLGITFSDYFKFEPLTCEATNLLSNATISTTVNLTVIDPFSVRPATQALPVAGESFSLQCVGPQEPATITWLKNKHKMPASERVRLSPDNTTITFSLLFRADGGLYQCVVGEEGPPILSVGYLMQVNYGPDQVSIYKPGGGPVGAVMYAQPGSTTELQCVATCFPVCSISWFYGGSLLATKTSISFTPAAPPYTTPLTCVALNPATKQNLTAETTVVVPDGPKNVVIKGPASLEIGVTASLTCSAECTPSCSFQWTVYGKTMTGSVIDITLNRYISEESVSCQAQNTYTGQMATTNETLSVSDPQWCGC
ncbi:hypothetical protein PBY51_008490 [Eleginops maclovinus]|uniref:Ig-like domain-containing protein n=1 Tax=Eleginops maclovinus TaxID=56733 RepID=A0AAN8AB77_ELEMC|nr:hypothetical protein PBY51_008490 [Eleginops maclovinus]